MVFDSRVTICMKKLICILLIVTFSIELCGCWNNYDLENLNIVVGIGFDKGDNGNVKVTAEVLSQKPSQNTQGSGTSGGGGGARGSVLYTVEGRTFFDAIRNFIPKSSKRFYWNDLQIIVLSDTFARNGISDILDFFARDHQANIKSDIVIAKELTAKEVLESQPSMEPTTSTEINDALIQTNSYGKNVKITLFDIFKQQNYLHPCTIVSTLQTDNVKDFTNGPSVSSSSSSGENNGNTLKKSQQFENILVQGSAVLKDYKLLGYLTPDETRGIQFAQDKIHGTIIVVRNPEESGKMVSIRLTNSKGKINVIMEGGKPKLSIEVQAIGTIGDQQGSDDLTNAKDINFLTTEACNEIKNEIRSAMDHTKNEFKSDVIGFSEEIYKNYNSQWNKIGSDWDDIYSKSNININVGVRIQGPGMITRPLL